MSDTHFPVFSTRVTAEEMAEQSRKATAEGMKELATAMSNKRIFNEKKSENFDSEYDSDSDIYSNYNKKFKKSNSTQDMNIVVNLEKLENRIHYLGLDLTNAKVEIDDANTKIEELNKQITPYMRINDELVFLKSSLSRALKDTENMNMLQLEQRLKLFNEEANEHSVLCNTAILMIEHNEIKIGMLRVLNAERKRIVQLVNSLKFLMFKTRIKNTIIMVTSSFSIAVLIIAVLYNLINIYM
jgi:hypothetical protein